MVETSIDWMTALGATLQKRATFRRKSEFSSCSVRNTSTSGCTPISSKAFTECWVGFVFNSPEADKKGTSVKWINTDFSPNSHRNCRTASMKGKDSMSPTVPPISVITTSYSPLLPNNLMFRLISSVICGMT